MIERRIAGVKEVLVFDFASIPILTRSYASAMRLAMHCNVDTPPHGRWIKQAPDDCAGAIELARQRRIKEALAINSAATGRSSALSRANVTRQLRHVPVRYPGSPSTQSRSRRVPAPGEANGRTRMDGCAGPRTHARRLSGASSRLLPRTAPPCLINKARPPTAWIWFCRL